VPKVITLSQRAPSLMTIEVSLNAYEAAKRGDFAGIIRIITV
jgi:hypothetical protein